MWLLTTTPLDAVHMHVHASYYIPVCPDHSSVYQNTSQCSGSVCKLKCVGLFHNGWKQLDRSFECWKSKNNCFPFGNLQTCGIGHMAGDSVACANCQQFSHNSLCHFLCPKKTSQYNDVNSPSLSATNINNINKHDNLFTNSKNPSRGRLWSNQLLCFCVFSGPLQPEL